MSDALSNAGAELGLCPLDPVAETAPDLERLDRREALRPSLETLVADRDLAALANRVTQPRNGGGERALDGRADHLEGVAGYEDCRDAVRQPGVGITGEQDVTGSREDADVASHPSHSVEARREGAHAVEGDAPVRWTHAVDPAVRRGNTRRPGTIAAKADVAQPTSDSRTRSTRRP